MKKTIISIVTLALIFIAIYYAYVALSTSKVPDVAEVPRPEPKLLNKVSYICKEGKMIDVALYENIDPATLSTSTPPIPPGIAKIGLNDGRTFTLPQTISADGARYSTVDESFVYWSKGNGALIQENGSEKEYRGCVELSSVTTQIRLAVPFVSSDATFSLRLPGIKTDSGDGYRVNESFENQLSPSTTIKGVQFTIPESVATGTNLSSDSYLSIEHIPNSETCDPNMFFDGIHATSTLVENGITYLVASSSNAGAGNRYEEIVYAVDGSNPCVAVRNVLHYHVLENYASGTVTEFDELSLKAVFDQIRKTITFNF